MPRRRSFLIGFGCLVASPGLAAVPWPLASSPPPVANAPVEPVQNLELRIAGWETEGVSPASADGHALIRINSNWRAAWR